MEFENKLGSNAPPLVDERVTVHYDPQRPVEEKVAYDRIVRRNAMAFAVAGAIVLGGMVFPLCSSWGVFALIAVWQLPTDKMDRKLGRLRCELLPPLDCSRRRSEWFIP